MDIICVGEILIDFISKDPGRSLAEVSAFGKHAGGAPANVAAGLAKLDIDVGFAGRVGADPFGRYLRGFMQEQGVEVSLLQTDNEHNTRLAFVELDTQSDRSFEFWERDPADIHLEHTDELLQATVSAKIVHFGSLALSSETGREKYFSLLDRLPRDVTISCFDPNYRAPLWKSELEAREVLNEFALKVQVLKLSEEEALFLADSGSIELAAEKLLQGKTVLVVITRGNEGCYLRTQTESVHVEGFQVETIDTTGCGDAFTAGLLSKILESDITIEEFSEEKLCSFGRFASATGAMTARQYGATHRLPGLSEVEKFLENQLQLSN